MKNFIQIYTSEASLC